MRIFTLTLLLALSFAALGLSLAGCQRSTTTAEWMVEDVFPRALEEFKRDVGRYPTQEEGLQSLVSPPLAVKGVWRGPYASAIPPDPWARPFVYRSPSREKGKSYDLVCLGQDGVETSDDVKFSK